MKMWDSRFREGISDLMERFSQSISFDKKLYKYDIEGSIAHVEMLSKQGIIGKEEGERIVRGLNEIKEEIESGNFRFQIQDEDIHTAIEKRLLEKIGDAAAKLHTARSRNDQISLDERLYLREKSVEIIDGIDELLEKILELAEKNIDAVMPGFTHLQHAQPILFSHYILAYYEKFKRDRERFLSSINRIDVMPLGSGALAGTSFPIDRKFVAEKLNFSKLSRNSIDSVSDRDFAVEFLSNCSIFFMHTSRLCEDFILFSSPEFGFLELPDAFCTGSSMMPQKKNPDALELIRGKTGRIYGNLISLLVTMKGLPLSYNRDLQEDKECIFDSVETTIDVLNIFNSLLPGIVLRKERMREAMDEFIVATDLADYLVRKGLSFRNAHRVVGGIVSFCEQNKRHLKELKIDELRDFSPLFDEDVYSVFDIERSIENRTSYGGTARVGVKKIIDEIKRERKIKEEGRIIGCPRCSYPVKVYENPIPTVDIITEFKGGIVLIKRRNYPYGWAIPGGFIGWGERAEDAAIREAKEETGLSVELKDILGVYSDPDRDPRSHTLSVVFVAKGKGILRAGDDAMEAAIFRRGEIPDRMAFDHKRILGDYFEKYAPSKY
ncbi:MAG: argininosuccinate lyase [Deltaproteobacteria bacterium]|nr:argininosuccinate lyase [Deltaproteobacteria bacterium]